MKALLMILFGMVILRSEDRDILLTINFKPLHDDSISMSSYVLSPLDSHELDFKVYSKKNVFRPWLNLFPRFLKLKIHNGPNVF